MSRTPAFKRIRPAIVGPLAVAVVATVVAVPLLHAEAAPLPAAQSLAVVHPVLPIQPGSAALPSAFTQFTDAQFLRLVPESSPRNYDFPSPAGDNATTWAWDPHRPDELKDTATGTAFPNPDYPVKTASVEVLSGKTVTVPYYDTPKGRSFIQARIDYEKREYLTTSLLTLARSYVKNSDERLARRIALSLDAWADHVPDYFMTAGWNTMTFVTPAQAAAADYKVQRASDHNGLAHEWGSKEVNAFDAIYDSPALAELATERGYDVRAHIAGDLFANIGDFFVKRVPIDTATSTNLSWPFVAVAQVATVLDRPDYIRWLDEYLTVTIDRNFARDGMYPESLGYHVGFANANRDVAVEVARYFTVRGADTPELRAIESRSAARVEFLKKSATVHCTVAMPNGVLPTFGDTLLTKVCPTRTSTGSALLPAFGVGQLGGGSGAPQVQLDESFSDNANHQRDEVLGLSLYGFGKELLNNEGYVHWPGREFANSTMSHNTVVVDRTNQYRSNHQLPGNASHLFTSGDALLYEPGQGGVGVLDVDGRRAYLNKATRYQRTLLLNRTDPAHPYAVDLFRVTGGKTQDYFLHGAIKFDETATSSVPMTDLPGDRPLLEPGETWTPPTGQYDERPWYGSFQSVRTATSPGNCNVTFTETGGDTGVRLSMVDDGASQLYLANSPVPLREGTPPAEKFDNWQRPSLIVRRKAPAGETLDTLFAGVLEPFSGAPVISNVERVPLADSDPEHIGLRVSFADGRVDTWLVNLNTIDVTGRSAGTQEVHTADGTMALRGRVGFVSTKAGSAVQAVTVAADELRYDGTQLTRLGGYEGSLTGVVRAVTGGDGNAFVTDASLPEGTALRGRWLKARFGTYHVVGKGTTYPLGIKEQKGFTQLYQIDHVSRTDGKTYVYLTGDPMLELSDAQATELARPERTFTGPTSFEIAMSAVPRVAVPS